MLKFTGIERRARTLALNGSSSMKLSRLVKLLSINTFLAEGSSCEAAGKMKTASSSKNVKMTGSAHRLIGASFAKPTRSGTRGPGPAFRPQYDIPHLCDSERALYRETLLGIPVCRTKGFLATGTTQAVDVVEPNAGGEGSARSLDRRSHD